jgi:mono/diheme cytochrome c family protein
MRYTGTSLLVLFGIGAILAEDRAQAPSPEAGKVALLEKPYQPAVWSLRSYDDVWKQWGVATKPADYASAFRDRYGLHPAPYANHELPMGMRRAPGLLGTGITTDCLLCHGGSIMGKSYVGLPNSTLDMHALYEEMSRTSGVTRGANYPFTIVRGTTEAGAFAVSLLDFRDADLNLRRPEKLPFRTDLCEDPPAWWLLKKKRTMYHDGGMDARSVRSIMQFLLNPLNPGEFIKQQERTFRDVQAYLLTIEPPRYPFSIDEPLAGRGRLLFEATCSKCHGTYGEKADYPNKIVPLEDVGTDPTRATGFSAEGLTHFNRSWFGQEKGPDGKPLQADHPRGYQAPPLDGVWATAPYFHNGSVPTLYHVLNSKDRPRLFTRSFRTDAADYDEARVGWKFTEHLRVDPQATPLEQRKVYDTTQPGRGNRGHTFGDKFSEEERRAVIEYLKTL